MLMPTDETIDNAIANISGYIVTTAAEKLGLPPTELSENFFSSGTYALLRNKETGYYWDSMSELIDLFLAEVALPLPSESL
jgi:hypothetical protein